VTPTIDSLLSSLPFPSTVHAWRSFQLRKEKLKAEFFSTLDENLSKFETEKHKKTQLINEMYNKTKNEVLEFPLVHSIISSREEWIKTKSAFWKHYFLSHLPPHNQPSLLTNDSQKDLMLETTPQDPLTDAPEIRKGFILPIGSSLGPPVPCVQTDLSSYLTAPSVQHLVETCIFVTFGLFSLMTSLHIDIHSFQLEHRSSRLRTTTPQWMILSSWLQFFRPHF